MSVQTSELRGTLGIVRCLYILPVGVEATIFAAAVFRGFPKEHCAVEFQWISCGTMHMCVVLNNVLEFKMQHVQHPVGRATYTADKSSVAHVVSGLFWHIGGGTAKSMPNIVVERSHAKRFVVVFCERQREFRTEEPAARWFPPRTTPLRNTQAPFWLIDEAARVKIFFMFHGWR